MDSKLKTENGNIGSPKTRERAADFCIRASFVRGFAIVGVVSILKSLSTQWRVYTQPHASTTNDIFPDIDYPLRPSLEPWNISTSSPYPRKFEKVVTEGTWLRIATHPIRDEIVFDMLGDLYCMSTSSNSTTQAKPFLSGIPFDKEAEFSSDGTSLVFISDAGFGVDNVWTLPYSSCSAMSSKSEGEVRASTIQQTNSTFRFFSSPALHPGGENIVATKWFLTGRPNGAGEIWEIPSVKNPVKKLPEHSGTRVIARKLPGSWSEDRYIESQLGVEQARYTPKGDAIIYSRNIRDDGSGKFSYNKDVHKGVNAIFLFNTTTKKTKMLVDAFPGGANMPRISSDGQTLAFVRRVGVKSVLVLKDLRTGTIQHAWGELTYDVSLIPAFMGAYPNYGFSSGDKSIIIWSSGKVWNVPLKFNGLGERVRKGNPRVLDFEARIELAVGETVYSQTNISAVELGDEGRVHALRALRSSVSGDQVVFEAAGDTYLRDVTSNTQRKIPKTLPDAQYYGPSFVSGTNFVLHARWSDTNLTILELVEMRTETQIEILGVPRGRYLSPLIQDGKIAFVRTGSDYMLGDVEETAGEGVWIGDISLPISEASGKTSVVRGLKLVEGSPAGQDTKLNFGTFGDELYLIVQSEREVVRYDTDGKRRRILATGKSSVEMVLVNALASGSLLGSWMAWFKSTPPFFLAFRDYQHAWIAQLSEKEATKVWSKPQRSSKRLLRLSKITGHDITFSGDGSKVFWLSGPHFHYASTVDIFSECGGASASSRDSGECAAPLVRSQEVNVTYKTELSNLKTESNGTHLVFYNATIISMDPTFPKTLLNGTIVLYNGTIAAIGAGGEVKIPENSYAINALGGAILPGYIDVHGHWGGFLSQYPSASWELETFLGYGVTTIHNPSSKNVGGFVERSLVEKGAFYGPRIYHTGDVLYGSHQANVYTEINSLADARTALLGVKIEGGESSFSVKNYQLVSRSARQRLLLEAQKLKMLVVPEGGWSLDWDLTYFIDGFTTLEHPVPIPTLYEDVLSLIAFSGSSYTQISVMNYGGLFGQNWVHQNNDVPDNKKLRRYVKHDILESLTEVKQAPNSSYQFFNTTISTAKLAARGVRTNIGAHGEQPIGFLFHSEMEMLALGGQNDYEVLNAATIGGATSLGLQGSVGSLKVGKMADLVVYPEGVGSVEGVMGESMGMRFVVRGGRVFEVEDGLVEYWPRRGRRGTKGRINWEDNEYTFV